MTKQDAYTLTTDEIKEAVTDYINKTTNNCFLVDEIEGFDIHKSNRDSRIFTGYIIFVEKVDGS